MNPVKRSLEELAHLSMDNCLISFEWEQQSNYGAALSSDGVKLFDMTNGIEVDLMYLSLFNAYGYPERSLVGPVHAQSWSPHNNGKVLGIAVGKDVVSIDFRSNGDLLRIKDAHSHRTLHLDFNPNLQHVFIVLYYI
uniref:ANAPC4_WD40 domain-containing protein n=1 Tax=Heterorhabditis bacteriophora TaxID=37862 RepID=A0A1I7X1K4_HETBA